MTVNFKGNVWELQLSNAVFCHFSFSIDVNLTVYIPTATLLARFDCSFCFALAYALAIYNDQIWIKKYKGSGVRG